MTESPRRVAVLINGNARGVTDRVIKLVASVVPPEHLNVTRTLAESRAIIRRILARRYDAVLTGGGDGTFVQLVTELRRALDPLSSIAPPPPSGAAGGSGNGATASSGAESRMPAVGVLKLGTGNAMGILVGANDPTEAGLTEDFWKARYTAGIREMRFIEVEGKVAPFSGVGLDAMILNDFITVKDRTRGTFLEPYLSGGAGYAAAIGALSIPRVATKRQQTVTIVNDGRPAWRVGPDGRRVGPLILKGETIWSGPVQIASVSRLDGFGYDFRLFPFAYVREDRVHLRVAAPGLAEILVRLPGIWRGEHFSDTIHDFLVDRVVIRSDRPMPFQIGGDGEGHRSFVRFSLSAEPIRLLDYRTAASTLPVGPGPDPRPASPVPPAG
jgi:diacylglycerol kinase family enzyme